MELEEETGLVDNDRVQVHTYGDPDREPQGRVVSVAHAALLDGSTAHPIQPGSVTWDAGWFPLEQLPGLAFDHPQIILDAYSRMADLLHEPALNHQTWYATKNCVEVAGINFRLL